MAGGSRGPWRLGDLPSSGSDPGHPDIACLKTPTFKNPPRPILGQFNDRPVAVKLDQPAAIDGPNQTGTATMHERTMAAAEQGQGIPT